MYRFDLTEEQQAIQQIAREFTAEKIIPVAGELDEEAKFPLEICREAWKLGLMNVELEEAYGGPGLGIFESCLINEELAYGCVGVATTVMGNGLAATPILIAGTDAQKKEYLGRLTSDLCFASYATSEPDAGSDVAGLRTRYERRGDTFVLNGSKQWITNASHANFFVIFATRDPSLRHRGISAFIVPADTPGLSVGKKENKMGQRASNTAQVHLEDVAIPAANLLGAEGEGFKIAMKTFDRTRPDIGAFACGIMRRALDESVRYAKERKAFGVAIAEHQAVQFMLAEMAIAYEAGHLLTFKAASLLDAGAPATIVSSYAKAFCADNAMQVATNAVQIFGGNGYVKEYPVEKLMRDAKLLQIYEGTSQIQRVVIGRHLLSR
jgi:acyl-CoA dehydrogenase